MAPTVSVIVPTYNRAALVPRALRSALKEVEPTDEVIVVDDGSTDGTEAAVRPFRHRVRYVRVPHGGAGRARNRGVALARGRLVAFLDSDDEWLPGKLRLQRALLEQSDALFCFSDFATCRAGRNERHGGLSRWRDDGRGWDDILGPGRPFSALTEVPAGCDDCPVHIGDLYPELVRHDLVPTFTLAVDREAAGEPLRFAEDLPTYEDLECHVRLARAGRAAFLACETARQWGHEGPRLSTVDDTTWAAARLAVVERTYGRDPAFQAAYPGRFEDACTRQRLAKARTYLGRGDTRAARHELRRAGRGPAGYWVAACLPGWRRSWVRQTVRTTRRAVRTTRRGLRRAGHQLRAG